MTLQQLLREIHWIEWQLRAFEDKYGVRSHDFYRGMEAGELAEFDDGESQSFQDFLEWHGLHKLWLRRARAYDELLSRQSLVEQLRHTLLAA